MDYEILKKQTNVGWNTWNTRNVLSYSHLPEGFTINLCIKEYSNAMPLRESLVGRYGEYDEKIFPGARSYDGSCTQLNLKFQGLELDVRTVVADDEQYVILTPLKTVLHGHVHENFSGYDGMGCGVGNSDKFYHWDGLLAYIALDNEGERSC